MATGTLLDKTLNRLKFICLSLGLNLEIRKCTKLQKIQTRCVYVFNFIWLNSDLIGAVFFLKNGTKNGKDIREITFLAPGAILSAVSNLKSFYFIIYNDYINDLIDELRNLDENVINYNIEVKNVIEIEERKFLNFVINLLNVLNIGMVINFSFNPLILITLNYIRTGEIQLRLPFLDVYPFDPLDIKYWPFVYVKQTWSECIVLLEMCATDYFYYICCTYIRIQFRLLSYELENLIPRNHSRFRNSDQSEVRERLFNLIKWHQRIKSATNTLEFIYSKSTLLNFVASSVIICLTGFNVTTIDDVAVAVSFLTFLFMSLLQIFFLCLFGDMIMRSSLAVSDSVYSCLWYAADRKIAKDLLIVQIRAQSPCKLTAFGYADVNLRSFSKIISSAWSYFALLNTMYGANQE